MEELFTHNGKKIKKLGFGCMRLPMKNDHEIDMNEFREMVDIYLSSGYCYFDTAHGYHKQQSEIALGEILSEGFKRDDFLLATKLPAWKHYIHDADQARQIFYSSLSRLKTDYIDYYLFQNMGEERTRCFGTYNLWPFVKNLKDDGVIRHFGVSVHDGPEHIRYLLDKYPQIEFIQLQINYADWFSSSIKSKQCYEIAREYSKPIIVMEPLKGGMLINLPESIQKILDESEEKTSNAKLGFRFLERLEGIPLILSGMSNKEQVIDNIRIFNELETENNKDIKLIEAAGIALNEMDSIKCTACNYCIEECQSKVKIPKILNAMNMEKIFKNRHMAEHIYFSNVFLEGKASACIGCGSCERVCPQHIEIRKYMKEAVDYFGE